MPPSWKISSELDVPGMIPPGHCQEIKNLAQSLNEGSTVLEIGVWLGRSTWCWLSYLPENCSLISIDPFVIQKPEKQAKKQKKTWANPKIDEIMEFALANGDQQTFHSIINLHPRKHLLKKLFVGTSQDYAEQNPNDMYDVVWIDGDHLYEAIDKDLKNFENRTKIICGDDYHESLPDVIKAVDEMIKRTGKKFYRSNLDQPMNRFWKSE